jgi:hypothetical protein
MELGVVMGRNKHPLAPCKPRQAHSLHTAMERHKWEESVSWGQLSAREPSGGGGKCLLAVGRRVRQTRDRDTATAPACSSLAHECCVSGPSRGLAVFRMVEFDQTILHHREPACSSHCFENNGCQQFKRVAVSHSRVGQVGNFTGSESKEGSSPSRTTLYRAQMILTWLLLACTPNAASYRARMARSGQTLATAFHVMACGDDGCRLSRGGQPKAT